MIRPLSRLLKTAAVGLALAASASAFAQAFPNRPITMVVPWGGMALLSELTTTAIFDFS